MARKTVEVETVKNRVNKYLSMLKGNPEAQKPLCSLLESVLMDTDNYHGFSWPELDLDLVKSDKFNCDHPDYYTRHYY